MSDFNKVSGDRSSGTRYNTVAETCNRLSRYLKKRGNLEGLGLELARKLEPKGCSTSDSTSFQSNALYENMGNSAERPTKHVLMELFPQHAGVSCPRTREEGTYNALYSDHAVVESETAPMTMFYGGKLFVFDNFPAEKVKDLMLLAMGDKCSVSIPNQQTKAAQSELPMTRKTSFNRFMERRKDRAVARAPYQIRGGPSANSSTKHEEELILKL